MSPSPAPHETRSGLEAAVCEAMRLQSLPHEHRSLKFRVQLESGETVEFRPDVVARRGSILFLVVPFGDASDAGRIRMLSRFLEQHSPEIVLVVLADKGSMALVPPQAYDEIYDAADVAAVVRRIRTQDPDGMVRPFVKGGPGGGL